MPIEKTIKLQQAVCIPQGTGWPQKSGFFRTDGQQVKQFFLTAWFLPCVPWCGRAVPSLYYTELQRQDTPHGPHRGTDQGPVVKELHGVPISLVFFNQVINTPQQHCFLVQLVTHILQPARNVAELLLVSVIIGKSHLGHVLLPNIYKSCPLLLDPQQQGSSPLYRGVP